MSRRTGSQSDRPNTSSASALIRRPSVFQASLNAGTEIPEPKENLETGRDFGRSPAPRRRELLRSSPWISNIEGRPSGRPLSRIGPRVASGAGLRPRSRPSTTTDASARTRQRLEAPALRAFDTLPRGGSGSQGAAARRFRRSRENFSEKFSHPSGVLQAPQTRSGRENGRPPRLAPLRGGRDRPSAETFQKSYP